MPKIHLVTNDLLLGHTICRLLHNKLGYEVSLTSSFPSGNDVEADLFLYEVPLNESVQHCLPQLRKITQQLPVIALFKYGQHALIQAVVHQAGAVDYLTLPSSLERLQTTIKNALTIFHMRKALEQWGQYHFESPYMDTSPALPRVKAIDVMDQNGAPKKLSHLEKEIIQTVLRYHQGCLARTARQLGIGRTTLYRKLKNYTNPEEADMRQEFALPY